MRSAAARHVDHLVGALLAELVKHERVVVDGGDEVHSECCTDSTLGWLRDGGASSVDTVIEASDDERTRPDWVAEAAALCADREQTLGDWIAVYASDGVSVQRLYFGCA